MAQPNDPIAGLEPQEQAPHRAAGDKEEVYFDGSPLIRGDLLKVLLWGLFGLLLILSPFIYRYLQGVMPHWGITATLVVLGLLALVLPYLLVKRVRYRITNYRIDFERGLMSKSIDTLELWHVDDIKYHQSFFDRLFGVGTITIVSHDKTTPLLVIRGLPKPRPLFDSPKQRIIAVKRQRGVIKMDVG